MSNLDPVAAASVRRMARAITGIRRDVSRMQRASQGAFRGIHLSDGSLKFYKDDAIVGELKLSSGGGVILQPANDVPPPQPTAPHVESSTNLISVTWDGTFVNANRPDDLRLVEIHRSHSAGFAPTDLTQCNVFSSVWGGVIVFPARLSEGVWYVKLVAVDLAGNESVASAADSGTATDNAWA